MEKRTARTITKWEHKYNLIKTKFQMERRNNEKVIMLAIWS
jgi:hypothetical protein